MPPESDGGPVSVARGAAASEVESGEDRLTRLEREVAELRSELAALRPGLGA